MKDVLRKIRKCLDLAASPEPAEAAAALVKAQELMQQYGFTLQDVEFSRVREHASKVNRNARPSHYLNSLSSLIAERFGCYRYYDVDGPMLVVKFVGLEPYVEIAGYAYDVLQNRLVKARKAYYQKQNKRTKRATRIKNADAYALGWVQAVSTKLAKLIPSETRPAVVDSYVETQLELRTERVRGSQNLNGRQQRHAQRGYVDGMSEELQAGVKSQRVERGMLE